jgi:hypothetical protein
MILRILILGASYGSLFATKLLMAVHDVTLVCRRATADLINMSGTEVCLPLRDETTPRRIRSTELSGRLDAKPPEVVDPSVSVFGSACNCQRGHSGRARRQARSTHRP